MIKARLVVLLSACLSLCLASPAMAGPDDDSFGDLAEPLGKKVSFDLIGTPLDRALETVARQVDLNIIISPKRASTLSGLLVNLSIEELTASKTLNLIALATQTDWYIREGVVLFAEEDDIRALRIERRVYDIRELLESAPNYLGPRLGVDAALDNTSSGGSNASQSESYGEGDYSSGGLFGDDDSDAGDDIPSRGELVGRVMELIKASVGDLDDWNQRRSTVQEFNGTLIVNALPEELDEVGTLLNSLSDSGGRMIVSEGQFFVVPQRMVDALEGRLVLDAKAYQAFSAKLTGKDADGNIRRIASGRTVCFNGQRVYVYAGSDQAFLSDIEPIPDAFSVDPTLSTLRKGSVLDIKPTITLDGKQVSVALRSDVIDQSRVNLSSIPVGSPPVGSERVSTTGVLKGEVKLSDDETKPVTGTVSGGGTKRAPGANRVVGEAELGLPEQEILSLRTNVRIPDGGAVVLSGVTSQFGRIDADGMEIILVLRVRIND